MRTLRRNVSYTLINVIGLTLGLTCGILIFTLINFHLTFENFHADSDRIYRFVTEEHRDEIDYEAAVPNPFGKAFREDYTYGEKVARIATFGDEQITVESSNNRQMFMETVSFAEEDFFEIFNFPLIQGNMKTALSKPNTAILTEAFAKKYFKRENPINQLIVLDNNVEFRVTGVLKEFPTNTDFKTGIYLSYSTLKQFSEWYASDDSWGGLSSSMQCYTRLRPDADPKEIEGVLPAYVKKYRPESKNVHHYKLQKLSDIHFSAYYGGSMPYRYLYGLAFIGIFILVTACVNFINLATAQALNRSKEVGIRKVLGSLRKQLFWQFIIETAVITIFASMIAVELSIIFIPYLNEWFHMELSVQMLQQWELMLFIPLLAIVVTFFAGSYPGLILAGFQPVIALKGKLSQQSIGGFNTRRGLIITQLAIAQVLIIGVIVIFSQIRFMRTADLGFIKDAIVMIPFGSKANTTEAVTLKRQFEQIPGVEQISQCYSAPASVHNSWGTSIRLQGRSEFENFSVSHKGADANFIPTFGLELIAGRNVRPSDTVREFVVNEALVRKFNLGSPEEILGKKISINSGSHTAPVVGVIKDFHDRSFREDIMPIYITTYKESYSLYAVKLNPASIAQAMSSLEAAFTEMYPDQIFDYKFLDQSIAEYYENEATMFRLIQVFSLLAIFIGCLGLYGLVSFMAVQKNKEIGIRKVLGGSFRHILWLFGKEFTRLVLIAFLIAGPLAWWAMQAWLQDFTFRVELNAWMFGLAILISATIALFTVGYRAIRAAMVNPVEVLKNE